MVKLSVLGRFAWLRRSRRIDSQILTIDCPAASRDASHGGRIQREPDPGVKQHQPKQGEARRAEHAQRAAIT